MSEKIILRLRLGLTDAHYGGGLVAGARIAGLFGDAATALLIKHDGDEGLFVAYQELEFKAPVYAGDFLEIRASIVGTGRTSRTIVFEAWRLVAADPDSGPSAANWLETPELVARARGTCVVPLQRQRR